ncbi:integral membrane protein DUF92-domain-containing protein [Spinellus fusiger]|nr:integral membrane protein DUF92-domain-containing protein [Spinellus fusiger]
MVRVVFATCLSSLLALYAHRKKSLTLGGCGAAFALGMVTFSSNSFFFTAILLVFFLSSTKLTKFKAERKKQLEADYEQSSQRNVTQVICNGLTGGVAVGLTYCLKETPVCSGLSLWYKVCMGVYMGHYACCAGDTWASELGILNKGWPILITRLTKVPPGTNGGVSPLGLAASLAGGGAMGLTGALVLWLESPCYRMDFAWIVLGALAGLGGSLVDSVLGATVQQTLYSKDKKMIVSQPEKDTQVLNGYDLLDNHQVNFVSSLVTAATCGAFIYFTA